LFEFYRERIREHQRDFDENAESTDYVHAFLKDWKRRDQSGEQHFFWYVLQSDRKQNEELAKVSIKYSRKGSK
jgi:hypothetical protein